MFPIRDREGHVVGFGARAFGDEMPKYLNSPQTAIFDKSHLLYGLDRARDEIRRLDQVVIVEGYMDVLAAHQFGYANVVASMGTAVTESQLGLVKRLTRNVVLALDADSAGQNAMVRALEALPSTETEDTPVLGAGKLVQFERRLSVNIKVLAVPDGKDPDEYIRANAEHWPETVNSATPFLQFYIERISADIDLKDPRAKDVAVQRAAQLLSLLPDGVEMRHYVDILASRLRIADRDPILDAIRTARRSRSNTAGPVSPVKRNQPRVGTEDYLIGLVLTYPDILRETAVSIDPDEILDSTNREVLFERIVEGVSSSDLGVVLADRETSLRSLVDDRVPMSRIDVQNEAARAIEKMRRERVSQLMDDLRLNIADAEREGDRESLRLWLDAMNDLTTQQRQMYPRKSSVFRDSRDKRNASGGVRSVPER
jgi:DNA primase